MKTFEEISDKIDRMQCEPIYDGEEKRECQNDIIQLLWWCCETDRLGSHRTEEEIALRRTTLSEELIPWKLNPNFKKDLPYFITKNKIRFLDAVLDNTEWPVVDIYR